MQHCTKLRFFLCDKPNNSRSPLVTQRNPRRFYLCAEDDLLTILFGSPCFPHNGVYQMKRYKSYKCVLDALLILT